MLGSQYFNSHAVTKKDADAYDDMNPLGISGCKAKRAQPGAPVFDVHCRCGGGGSSEGCLDTEVDSVEKGFDDYATRLCKTEGLASYAIVGLDQPPMLHADGNATGEAPLIFFSEVLRSPVKSFTA